MNNDDFECISIPHDIRTPKPPQEAVSLHASSTRWRTLSVLTVDEQAGVGKQNFTILNFRWTSKMFERVQIP